MLDGGCTPCLLMLTWVINLFSYFEPLIKSVFRDERSSALILHAFTGRGSETLTRNCALEEIRVQCMHGETRMIRLSGVEDLRRNTILEIQIKCNLENTERCTI